MNNNNIQFKKIQSEKSQYCTTKQVTIYKYNIKNVTLCLCVPIISIYFLPYYCNCNKFIEICSKMCFMYCILIAAMAKNSIPQLYFYKDI